MAIDNLGLYVHIPYCVRKCNYCDFCSLPNGGSNVPDEYVSALCTEIISYKKEKRRCLDTVYFGGGTPSLLSVSQMQKILGCIRETFDISSLAEITFEANPGTINGDKAYGFKALGFNRVSLGLQSIHKNEMKKLGRIHSFEEFLSAFNLLRMAGFDNINVDLMYGIPYQTKESFESTVRTVVAISPEHISSYGLILEEGTPLFLQKDTVQFPTQDDECDMYDLCREILGQSGYEHYEISNYAKSGKRSRHNMLYWNLAEYIGVGTAAHSYLDGHRYYNTDIVTEYINSMLDGDFSRAESEVDLPFEYVMLKLRLSDGFLLSEYEDLFGKSFLSGREEIVDRLGKEGLLEIENGALRLTERGFYLSNSILVEFL